MRPALHHEDVLARALRHPAVGREQDGLVVAGLQGLDLGQRRVHVHAGPLGRRGHGVGVVALPRRHLEADAVGHPLVAQVGAPGPGGDGHADRARQGVEAHLAVAEVDDRADVAAVVEPVDPHDLLARRDELVGGVGHVDHEDLGRGEQPVDVVGEPEHGHPAARRIGADALEHARAVVQRVGEHVDAGLVPVDELAVEPDLLGRGDGHGLRAFLQWRRRRRRWTERRSRWRRRAARPGRRSPPW